MKRVLLASLPLWLAACSSTPPAPPTVAKAPEPPPPPVAQPTSGPQQLEFKLASGRYDCDAGAVVQIERNAADANRVRVAWHGKRFDLQRNPSASGLPRFENGADGLVWIDLPWKSYLLDQKSGKPLAADCKPA